MEDDANLTDGQIYSILPSFCPSLPSGNYQPNRRCCAKIKKKRKCHGRERGLRKRLFLSVKREESADAATTRFLQQSLRASSRRISRRRKRQDATETPIRDKGSLKPGARRSFQPVLTETNARDCAATCVQESESLTKGETPVIRAILVAIKEIESR